MFLLVLSYLRQDCSYSSEASIHLYYEFFVKVDIIKHQFCGETGFQIVKCNLKLFRPTKFGILSYQLKYWVHVFAKV